MKEKKSDSNVLACECWKCGSKEFNKDEFNRLICSFCKTLKNEEKKD